MPLFSGLARAKARYNVGKEQARQEQRGEDVQDRQFERLLQADMMRLFAQQANERLRREEMNQRYRDQDLDREALGAYRDRTITQSDQRARDAEAGRDRRAKEAEEGRNRRAREAERGRNARDNPSNDDTPRFLRPAHVGERAGALVLPTRDPVSGLTKPGLPPAAAADSAQREVRAQAEAAMVAELNALLGIFDKAKRQAKPGDLPGLERSYEVEVAKIRQKYGR